jgi:hypothetical protein
MRIGWGGYLSSETFGAGSPNEIQVCGVSLFSSLLGKGIGSSPLLPSAVQEKRFCEAD